MSSVPNSPAISISSSLSGWRDPQYNGCGPISDDEQFVVLDTPVPDSSLVLGPQTLPPPAYNELPRGQLRKGGGRPVAFNENHNLLSTEQLVEIQEQRMAELDAFHSNQLLQLEFDQLKKRQALQRLFLDELQDFTIRHTMHDNNVRGVPEDRLVNGFSENTE
ncbi:hypothetical protein K501DRAFT_281177 [Backusella circina FSU 941]|nr:hypothetical protein K501DRAFT_281177 [Backusella circina FSU 941]